MKSMLALLSLIALSCSSGCGQPRVDTTWVKPIDLEEDTLEWLAKHQAEWPESLVDDLNEIDKHNQKCREILGNEAQ